MFPSSSISPVQTGNSELHTPSLHFILFSPTKVAPAMQEKVPTQELVELCPVTWPPGRTGGWHSPMINTMVTQKGGGGCTIKVDKAIQ